MVPGKHQSSNSRNVGLVMKCMLSTLKYLINSWSAIPSASISVQTAVRHMEPQGEMDIFSLFFIFWKMNEMKLCKKLFFTLFSA